MALSLRGGRLADGSGGPLRAGEVHTDGAVQVDRAVHGAETLDCDGLVVAPGFIDTHTHSDLVILSEPELRFKTTQGVCCEVLGQDGVSVAPLAEDDVENVRMQLAGLNGDPPDLDWDWRTVGDYLDRIRDARPAVDACYLVPHGQVRRAVLGMSDRAPDELELDRMCSVLDEGLRDGGVGLSTGLIYPPCAFAATAELEALCRVVARHDGVFVVHIRSEGDYALESVAEVIGVARDAGCRLCISHIKLAGERNWSKLDAMVELVREGRASGVDICADQYPYTAGSTMMGAILPPWAHAGGHRALMRRLHDPAERARMRADMLGPPPQPWDNFWSWSGATGIRIADVPRADSPYRRFIGRTLAEAAGDEDPLAFAMRLLREEAMGVSMVAFSQSDEVVRALYQEPWVGVCSDGLVGGRPHPRTYGAFTRVLRWLVREEELVGLGEAVRKMTSLPAAAFGLEGLGHLRPGTAATLVAFDPAKVVDLGTFDEPVRFSEGVRHLVVNGRCVIRDGQPTGERPGRVRTGTTRPARP